MCWISLVFLPAAFALGGLVGFWHRDRLGD